MKHSVYLASIFLFNQVFSAALVVRNLDVPRAPTNVSALQALYNAASFLGKIGPTESTASSWELPVDDAAIATRTALIDGWRGALGNQVEWMRGQNLVEKLIAPYPKFLEWRQKKLLLCIKISAFTATNAPSFLESFLKGERVAFLIDISKEQDPPRPRWVTFGAFKVGPTIYVFTMDSDDGKNVFTTKTAGESMFPRALVESFFASTGSARAAHAGFGAPVSLGVAPVFARGLKNNSNMCYQNALLQSIAQCSPMRAQLQAQYAALEPAAREGLPADVQEFFNVITQLSESGDAYDPIAFCRAFQRRYPDYPIGEQQDSALFLGLFWSRLQDNRLLANRGEPRRERFDDGFHGLALQRQLRCRVAECARDSRTPDPADFTYMLPLAIPPGGAGIWPINDLLTHYNALEILSGDEQVECASCGRKTDHESRGIFRVHAGQQFLVLQIKRFQYRPDGTSIKLVPGITFPADGIIVIRDVDDVEHRFRVTSIVVHSGSLALGHYWAVTRAGIFNDSTATSDGGVAFAGLLASGLHAGGTGYLYFLERI